MKTPKAPTLHDVCIMQSRNGIEYHISTPHYNQKYPLALSLAKAEVVKYQKTGKGFYYVLPKNGVKPLNQLKLKLDGR